MKYLGIDFGTKRIGLAVSDEAATLAFPKSIVQGGKGAAAEVVAFCEKEGVSVAVIGESKNFKGEENAIMENTRGFAKELEAAGLKVVYEPEILSTVQAQQIQGDTGKLDASAAAIILQSYLDRLKFQSN
ncbi:MAG TPA: Holliday junction resolvase RuvX [Candidatus Paceibacterota bacterium]